jgi:hypothetical protein
VVPLLLPFPSRPPPLPLQEGERFRVSWAAAQQSETIRAGMAEEGFAEAQNHEMHFAEIRSAVLKKVVEYLEWHYTYKDAKNGTNVPDFAKGIEPEISLEL